MSFVKGLRCRECSREYPREALHVCEFCFGPLEVDYDYGAIRKELHREALASRERSMWRYRELLPLDREPGVGRYVGYTPLLRANNLAREWGLKELYVKNDAVNFPTMSFKDRVVAVALSKAREFGYDTVACATTGNLGNSVAAHAVQTGMKCYVFIPAAVEPGKIIATSIYGVQVIGISGNYDQVNRLSTEIAGKYGWAFVNINLRPYYAEGSKSFAFEILEQLNWRAPQHIVVPMAGGSLITKIHKALKEAVQVGLLPQARTKIHGAQAAGCAPIVNAVKAKSELFKPVRPQTIAHSIAIGNPADGFYAIRTIRESGAWAEEASDEELVEGIKTLARTEGIFTETAGGVTVAVAQKLISQGIIRKDESLVLSITGNGLKTPEAMGGRMEEAPVIEARMADFERLLGEKLR